MRVLVVSFEVQRYVYSQSLERIPPVRPSLVLKFMKTNDMHTIISHFLRPHAVGYQARTMAGKEGLSGL